MAKRFQRSPQDSSRLWLWGIHPCRAALENPQRHCFRLFMTGSLAKDLSPSCKSECIDSAALSRLLPEGAVHQGIAMEVAPLPEPSFEDLCQKEKGVLVILDQVTDPHNVGAILRTARALQAFGVVMTEHHAPPLSGVLAKAASGALEHLPVWKVTNLARTLDELKTKGFWTIGLDERAPKVLSQADVPGKIALVMGAEGVGLRHLTQEKCDFLVKLSTDPTFPTLNVSVALALALYELVRV
ncbi:MAG: 23S rRNA (guanosine(2251)-2'-O)-methyltransferase RlmB [Alphaproteobacteria bacterium]|jgi:23S rRNA (guanosine2251-2'-O)-methyltransferase|nr:23S rRNA (guanosine(2251)-2'-O)-methyltransferase RlmB [Alphaproteobacteria bacterium]MBP9777316.1 23S rRNA (guanosine(2251)-2'-O)-methyltransferase RlmB [Alphaproteobacteria bacterium]